MRLDFGDYVLKGMLRAIQLDSAVVLLLELTCHPIKAELRFDLNMLLSEGLVSLIYLALALSRSRNLESERQLKLLRGRLLVYISKSMYFWMLTQTSFKFAVGFTSVDWSSTWTSIGVTWKWRKASSVRIHLIELSFIERGRVCIRIRFVLPLLSLRVLLLVPPCSYVSVLLQVWEVDNSFLCNLIVKEATFFSPYDMCG